MRLKRLLPLTLSALLLTGILGACGDKEEDSGKKESTPAATEKPTDEATSAPEEPSESEAPSPGEPTSPEARPGETAPAKPDSKEATPVEAYFKDYLAREKIAFDEPLTHDYFVSNIEDITLAKGTKFSADEQKYMAGAFLIWAFTDGKNVSASQPDKALKQALKDEHMKQVLADHDLTAEDFRSYWNTLESQENNS